jgi:glycosyltransferase involved in cell wall biosynthesis
MNNFLSCIQENINYSIIIPHKNIAELLQRCLNSIPYRKDIQILVIDDNSDPDKVDFEHFPGLNTPNIEVVFTKEGKGAGYARNIGLARAKGKWLLFADADDYFTAEFLEIIDAYKDASYDLIYFGINGIDSKTKSQSKIGRKYSRLMGEASKSQNFDMYKYSCYVPWGKMIKSGLVSDHNILFDEIPIVNDAMFSLKTAYAARHVWLDNRRIYTNVSRDGSLSKSRTLPLFFKRFEVFVNLNYFMESIGQKKYKPKITPWLIHLVNIKNMEYFYRAMKLIRKHNINLFAELFIFALAIPQKIQRKILYDAKHKKDNFT